MTKTKLNMQLVALFLISLSISVGIAQEHGKGPGNGGERGQRPQLTDEQKTCLESKIGVIGQAKPTRESMAAAFAECGVEAPKGPPPGERGNKKERPAKKEETATAEEVTQAE